jgi:DNA-binding response OmpR family regulator
MSDLGRILIADDEETFLDSTADLLRKEGYFCDCAPNASTASDMLRKSHYDLIIADIKMPGNFQLEFIKEVHQIVVGLPVILVTGYPTLDTAIQSFGLPVVAYLVKPFEFEILMSHIQTTIKNARIHQTLHVMNQRLQDWRTSLSSIESALTPSIRTNQVAQVDAFLSLTFENIIDVLLDLRHVTESFTAHNMPQEVCHLFNCPRLNIYIEAVAETVEVLERTKAYFRSKELGLLRKKLDTLMKENLPQKPPSEESL